MQRAIPKGDRDEEMQRFDCCVAMTSSAFQGDGSAQSRFNLGSDHARRYKRHARRPSSSFSLCEPSELCSLDVLEPKLTLDLPAARHSGIQ